MECDTLFNTEPSDLPEGSFLALEWQIGIIESLGLLLRRCPLILPLHQDLGAFL